MNDEIRSRILSRRAALVAAALATTAVVACEKLYACLEPMHVDPPVEPSADAGAQPLPPAVCLEPGH